MARTARTRAAEDHDDDGRPDRRAAQARPRSTTSRMRQEPYSWFEQQRDPSRAGQLSRATCARVYPGFLQHLGFIAMNPDRHLECALDYSTITWCAATATAPIRTASSTTNTTRCSTCRPSTTSTRSRRVFQEFALPKGACDVRGELVRPAGDPRRPRCSPSKASSTTSRATARPKPRSCCASTSRASGASTSWRPASATTAFSAAASFAS